MPPLFTKSEAREALEGLVAGIAPTRNVARFISVGLEKDIEVFDEEYFGEDGLLRPPSTIGSVKVIEAYYGGGKTHYLKTVEELAHQRGFASSFIELSKDSCPLTRFDLVYQRIAEGLTVPATDGRLITGLAAVIRHWVASAADLANADHDGNACLRQLGDLPIPSMRIAIEHAAQAVLSGDETSFAETLVYLSSGRLVPELRRRGVLESIDSKTGMIAIRSLAVWLRQIGFPGMLVVMDEGDRSLSVASTKDKHLASNNLVQLINETLGSRSWAGVMFLYSIPSWEDFRRVMAAQNPALEQRLTPTGFPNVPPAPRICLDESFGTEQKKVAFCEQVGVKIFQLFRDAYPNSSLVQSDAAAAATVVALEVVESLLDVSYRRRFVQSYSKVLYQMRRGQTLTDEAIVDLVRSA